ncbi:PEPxxWA-CTERM sorting domain-containing protein [Sphingomonas nostoxanthinifaciens]|nr:PEPxxWA-CTERM sorting domain-containing protein [Sphingomonas nostoxanthinifaciens]
MFDVTKYSAIAIASDIDCGGCDLRASDVAAISAHATAISAFFNAGGGILGMAAADDPLGYAYVPEAAVNGGGSPPSSGFVETAEGTAAGLVAENGDPTHNYFPTPGTGGLSSAYQVAETNTGNVESIFVKNGTISCTGPSCTITSGVPEPASWAMMLSGFGLLGGAMRRRQRTTVSFG